MKTEVLSTDGKKVKEIDTKIFGEPISQDIIAKVVEAEKIWQPWSHKLYAGMNISASGRARKTRHSWKSDRGRGMARIPKKTMWRRGTQFNWVGAVIPGTRGGRRAHGPTGTVNLKKINKKEFVKALLSSFALSSSPDHLKQRYSSLKEVKIKTGLPIIVEDKITNLNSKEFLKSLKKILEELYIVAIQNKSQRAGIGKLRGRKYKKNRGMLLVIGKESDKKISGIDVVKSNEIVVSDVASNGARLVVFTETAVKELEVLVKEKEKTSKKDTEEKAPKKDLRKVKRQKRKEAPKPAKEKSDKPKNKEKKK